MTEISKITEYGWNFDNSYARLSKTFYTSLNPTPVRSPELVLFNHTLAGELGLQEKELVSTEGIGILAGNKVPDGASPLAQAYAGHQYGHFTMLGDGRAILLGEQVTPQGKRLDIQLKGSGRTPYSRGGDGRAALGPMLREYIISEAMYALGIPTTRSLAVVTTGETVYRETNQPGAVLTRIADSHIRVGTFQYAERWGTKEKLKELADYTLSRHFIEGKEADNPYLFLLDAVVKRQAALIAKWQLIGFIHGVMNTDNMAVSGETIDYGPCAFMDIYDPATVFSSIDTRGRYAYDNQPYIAAWNLSRFAETLLPFIDDRKEQAIRLAQDSIEGFTELYKQNWLTGMLAKLGIFGEEPKDKSLVEELLQIMQKHGADFTNTFLALTFNRLTGSAMFESEEFQRWMEDWQARLGRQKESKEESIQLMKKSNPALIPRNHRVEEALEAAVLKGDYGVMERFLSVLSKPYAHLPEQAEYAVLAENTACPYRTFCGT